VAKWNDEVNKTTAATAVPFPRMLTLDEVQEVLNLGKPLIYALVKSGELRAAQFGGRGIWRVRQDDLAAYIDAAYAKTAERIASGLIAEGDIPAEDTQ
jgi:excisionase family DNA binding protein